MAKCFVDIFSPTIAAIYAMVVILRVGDDVDKTIRKVPKKKKKERKKERKRRWKVLLTFTLPQQTWLALIP